MSIQTKDILSEIVSNKKAEVAALSPRLVSEFMKRINDMPATKDFVGSISGKEDVSIVAEIKKSSPSLGVLRRDINVGEMASLYQRCGASAISVLTDMKYFGGSIEDLIEARRNINLPILRKDFVIDKKQIFEARAYGADAILLIVAALDDHKLLDFKQTASGLGLACLFETHTAQEVDRALKMNPSLVGINNRNLKTLDIDLSITEELRALIPNDICVISESGIRSKSDISRLRGAGVNAFLIGSSIVRADNPEKALREFTEK